MLKQMEAVIGAAVKRASKDSKALPLRLIAASRIRVTAATGLRATGQYVFMTKSSGKNTNQDEQLMS